MKEFDDAPIFLMGLALSSVCSGTFFANQRNVRVKPDCSLATWAAQEQKPPCMCSSEGIKRKAVGEVSR